MMLFYGSSLHMHGIGVELKQGGWRAPKTFAETSAAPAFQTVSDVPEHEPVGKLACHGFRDHATAPSTPAATIFLQARSRLSCAGVAACGI